MRTAVPSGQALKLDTTTWMLGCLLAALFLAGCSEDASELTKVVVSDLKEVSQQSHKSERSDSLAFDLRMQLQLAPAGVSRPVTQNQDPDASPVSDSLLERAQRINFGDLDSIRKRRFLRVLVTYSRTNFFFHQGMPRGFEYDLMMEYENTSIVVSSRRIRRSNWFSFQSGLTAC